MPGRAGEAQDYVQGQLGFSCNGRVFLIAAEGLKAVCPSPEQQPQRVVAGGL